MIGHSNRIALLGGTILATAAIALPAQAQVNAQTTASDPAAEHSDTEHAQTGGLEAIVVTARKRNELIQDIPVAVSAFSQAQIERSDLTSVEKIASYTPQMTVGRASNGSGAQISMRGIGSNSTSLGIEQSVAVVVDGAYSGQGRVINEGFFDLGRVEVLKGPQALFFGKNATAGVVSLTTADPTDTLYVKARAGYEFKADQVVLEGVVSGPLSETLSARLAVRGSKMYGGYYTNISDPIAYDTFDVATGITTPRTSLPSPNQQPKEKELLARATLLWKPSSSFSWNLKGTVNYNTE